MVGVTLKDSPGEELEAIQRTQPNGEIQNYCCGHGTKGRWICRGNLVLKPQV